MDEKGQVIYDGEFSKAAKTVWQVPFLFCDGCSNLLSDCIQAKQRTYIPGKMPQD